LDKKLKPCETAAKKVKHTADADCVVLYIKSPTPPLWSFRHEEDSTGHATLHHWACDAASSGMQLILNNQAVILLSVCPWSWRHHNRSKCQELLTECHCVTHPKKSKSSTPPLWEPQISCLLSIILTLILITLSILDTAKEHPNMTTNEDCWLHNYLQKKSQLTQRTTK